MICAHKKKYKKRQQVFNEALVTFQEIEITWSELDKIQQDKERTKDYITVGPRGGSNKFYLDDCIFCQKEKPTFCIYKEGQDCELGYLHDGQCNPPHKCDPCWCKQE